MLSSTTSRPLSSAQRTADNGYYVNCHTTNTHNAITKCPLSPTPSHTLTASPSPFMHLKCTPRRRQLSTWLSTAVIQPSRTVINHLPTCPQKRRDQQLQVDARAQNARASTNRESPPSSPFVTLTTLPRPDASRTPKRSPEQSGANAMPHPKTIPAASGPEPARRNPDPTRDRRSWGILAILDSATPGRTLSERAAGILTGFNRPVARKRQRAPKPGPTTPPQKRSHTMRTDAQRTEKYVAKTVATTVGLKVAAQLTYMKPSYAAFVNDFSAMQALVTACIAGEGVRPIEAGGYQAFAAKLWKLQNSTADPTLTNVATSYGKQFKSRGLNGTTLMKVALDVFTLVIVIP